MYYIKLASGVRLRGSLSAAALGKCAPVVVTRAVACATVRCALTRAKRERALPCCGKTPGARKRPGALRDGALRVPCARRATRREALMARCASAQAQESARVHGAFRALPRSANMLTLLHCAVQLCCDILCL